MLKNIKISCLLFVSVIVVVVIVVVVVVAVVVGRQVLSANFPYIYTTNN